MNAAIAELVTQINERVSRHLGANRRVLFEDLERSTLKPLPAEPYVFAQWKQCRVGLDYHVEVEKHYYSVPHQLLRETVWARISASQRRDLMEIVEDRHGRGSLLITSQLPVATWHEVIGEPTLSDAILDRIVHNAYRLELDGPSMRKIKADEAAATVLDAERKH